MACYAITVAFDLQGGARERFLELVSQNARTSVGEEPGCLRFDVLTPLGAEAPDVLLYEIYENRTAFEVHLASSHFRRFDEATRDLVQRKSVVEFWVSQNTK